MTIRRDGILNAFGKRNCRCDWDLSCPLEDLSRVCTPSPPLALLVLFSIYRVISSAVIGLFLQVLILIHHFRELEICGERFVTGCESFCVYGYRLCLNWAFELCQHLYTPLPPVPHLKPAISAPSPQLVQLPSKPVAVGLLLPMSSRVRLAGPTHQ
jgi:hypothetical protein